MVVASVAVGGRAEQRAVSTTTTVPATEAATTVGSDPVDPTAVSSALRPLLVPDAAGRVRFGNGPALGVPSGLVALVVAGDRVFRVDLDDPTVTLTSIVVDGQRPMARTTIGLLVARYGNEPILVPPDGGDPIPLAVSGSYVGEGPPGRLWFADEELGRFRLRFVAPTSAGAVVEAELGDAPDVGLGGRLVVVDGELGALAVGPDGTYLVSGAAPPRRISPGRVSGAAGAFALEQHCAEQLDCTTVVLDVGTGERRALPSATPDTAGFGAALSPDGRYVVVSSLLGAGNNVVHARLTLVGLDGTSVELGGSESVCVVACAGAPAWSPDGSWLVGVRDTGTLWAWAPGRDAPVTITLPNATVDGWPLYAASVVVVPAAWTLTTLPVDARG